MPTDRSLIGREYYVFRDSTHNLIFIKNPDLGRLLRSLLDTAEFQRLRRVKQNGLGFLVYPSMETTRFPHAVGSFAVAQRVIQTLQDQEPLHGDYGFPTSLLIHKEAGDGFCIAAALHDIGHGPLSHSWELILKRLERGDNRFVMQKHEQAGSDIINSEHTELGLLLRKLESGTEGPYPKAVIEHALKFLHRSHHLSYLQPLLSGNLDIDRLDFTNRDTRAAGVTYGDHDLDWLIRSLRFGRLPRKSLLQSGNPWVIAVDGRKGLNALVQYLRARENMYSLVYLHKTVRAADAHLGTIFVYAAQLFDQGVLNTSDCPLLEFLKSKELPQRGVAALDDSDVWYALKVLTQAKDELLAALSARFLSRKLFKSRAISAETADALSKLKSDGAFGAKIRKRLQQKFHALRDESQLPNKVLCDLFLIVDDADYDVVGEQKGEDEETWIMYRRHIDLGLRPLREYWEDAVGRTRRELKFVHFLPEIESDVLEIITPLEGAFSKLGQALTTTVAPLPKVVLPEPPPGYVIKAPLSEQGRNKEAYIGICEITDRAFGAGDVCVLKRYKSAESQTAGLKSDTIDTIFGIRSGYLAKSVVMAQAENVWLVERLWATDLLKLTQDAGIRTDLSFLLHMARDLFIGLGDLAKKNIRHGDIKLENCGLVAKTSADFDFQIGDFGLATADPEFLPEERKFGNLCTRPPELLRKQGQTVHLKSDVWSLAATIYAAAVGRYPFIDKLQYTSEEKQQIANRLKAELDNHVLDFSKRIVHELPPILGNILRPCFAENPLLRPDAASVGYQLGAALVESEKEPKTPLLWQRGLDVMRLRCLANEQQTLAAISSELAEIKASGNQWISPTVAEFSSDGCIVQQ